MTTPMIETQSLTRHFTAGKRKVEAVRDLELRVESGELVALLGPNGAGKSTTLRMLTTLIPPTSGSARVAGHDVVTGQREVRRRIGYVGQGNGAGHTQLGKDELLNQGRAYGLTRAMARQRAEELIAGLDLDGVVDRQVQTLSGGQRRRLDIALGMIHAPELLFLDEPSTGLDPQNRANLQEQVVRLHREHGTTIVMTTHYLDEADAMAQRVVIVDHGRIIADDTSSRLKESLGDRVVLGFGTPEAAAEAARRADDGVSEIVAAGPSRVEFRRAGGSEFAAALIRDLARVDVPVASVEVARPTLDDVFLALTGRSLRDAGSTPDTDNNDQEVAA